MTIGNHHRQSPTILTHTHTQTHTAHHAIATVAMPFHAHRPANSSYSLIWPPWAITTSTAPPSSPTHTHTQPTIPAIVAMALLPCLSPANSSFYHNQLRQAARASSRLHGPCAMVSGPSRASSMLFLLVAPKKTSFEAHIFIFLRCIPPGCNQREGLARIGEMLLTAARMLANAPTIHFQPMLLVFLPMSWPVFWLHPYACPFFFFLRDSAAVVHSNTRKMAPTPFPWPPSAFSLHISRCFWARMQAK